LPEHGAFPEVLAETAGGLLHRPEDPSHLAQRLHQLLTDAELRRRLAQSARQAVLARRSAQVMARATAEALREVVRAHRAASPRIASPTAAP